MTSWKKIIFTNLLGLIWSVKSPWARFLHYGADEKARNIFTVRNLNIYNKKKLKILLNIKNIKIEEPPQWEKKLAKVNERNGV